MPLLVLLAGWVQGLPALAYFGASLRTRAAAYVVMGSLVSLLSNATGRILAEAFGNNQVGSYISSPVTLAFFMGALAEYQQTARERRTFRMGILAFVGVWVLLVAFVETMTDFDRVTATLYSLTLVATGLWTLLRRASAIEQLPIHQTDWFWISLGIVVSGTCTAIASPLGAILLERGEYQLFNRVWQVRGATITVAYLMVSWGIYRGPPAPRFISVEGN